MAKHKRYVGAPADKILEPIIKEDQSKILKEALDKEPDEILADNEIRIADVIEEVDGVVDGVSCHLNVRETPEVKVDNVLTYIKKGTKIKVVDPKKDITGSGEKWHKIIVTNVVPPIHGYAMKKYIRILN